MTKIIFSLLSITVLLLSCNSKTEPKLHKYYVSIHADRIQLRGGIKPETKTDTLMAKDDLDAFKNALIAALSTYEVNKSTKGGELYYFSLADSNRISVRLNPLQVDSIIHELEAIRPKTAREVGEKFFYGF